MFQFMKMMRFSSLLSRCTPIAQSHCHIVAYKWFTAPLEFSRQPHLLFLPLISLHSCSLVTIGHYIKINSLRFSSPKSPSSISTKIYHHHYIHPTCLLQANQPASYHHRTFFVTKTADLILSTEDILFYLDNLYGDFEDKTAPVYMGPQDWASYLQRINMERPLLPKKPETEDPKQSSASSSTAPEEVDPHENLRRYLPNDPDIDLSLPLKQGTYSA